MERNLICKISQVGLIHQHLRSDLAKFHHFGKIFKVLGNFSTVHLLFGKILNLLWQILYTFGQFFFAVNGQMLKNNPAILSHCLRCEIC